METNNLKNIFIDFPSWNSFQKNGYLKNKFIKKKKFIKLRINVILEYYTSKTLNEELFSNILLLLKENMKEMFSIKK